MSGAGRHSQYFKLHQAALTEIFGEVLSSTQTHYSCRLLYRLLCLNIAKTSHVQIREKEIGMKSAQINIKNLFGQWSWSGEKV